MTEQLKSYFKKGERARKAKPIRRERPRRSPAAVITAAGGGRADRLTYAMEIGIQLDT